MADQNKDLDKNARFPPEFLAVAGTLVAILSIGTVVYHYLEKWSWVDSFYFTVVTMATVGYGDLHPTTTAGRLFTSFFILFSIPTAVAAFTVVGTRYLEQRTALWQKRRKS